MLRIIFQNVVQVTLTTSVIVAALLLLLPLFRKKYSAKWRYLVWLVIAVRLLIPFNPSLPLPPIELSGPSRNIEIPIPAANPAAPRDPAAVTAVTPRNVKPEDSVRFVSLDEISAIVWITGVLVFMLYNILGYFIFRKSVKRYLKPVTEDETDVLWREVKDEMGVKQPIRLYSCKKVASPMMAGFFKPILILPEMNLDHSDLSLILKHELVHFKRKDIWYKLLLVCANGLHWFNPLIYVMSDLADKDMEMVCDSEVIKDSDLDYKRKYSETILSVIHKGNIHNTAFSTYFHGGKKTMKKRFSNIFDNGKKRKGVAALCVILAAAGLIGGLVAWERKDTAPVVLENGGLSDLTDNTDTSETPENNGNPVETAGDTESADSTDTSVQDGSSGEAAALIPQEGDTSGDPRAAGNGSSGNDPVLTATDSGNTADNGSAGTGTPEAAGAGAPSASGAKDSKDSILYENDQYGFTFTLPLSWDGYSIITDNWEGYSMKDPEQQQISETGPILSIRHPLWTSKNPRQDIPIMVFTLSQWDEMQQEDGFHIGAAPINPSELGRNSRYVFALPARYNFAFPEGYEEVEDIINSKALNPTEDIAK